MVGALTRDKQLDSFQQRALNLLRTDIPLPPDVIDFLEGLREELHRGPENIPISRQQQVQSELEHIFGYRVRDPRFETNDLFKLDDVLRVATSTKSYTDSQKQKLKDRIIRLDQASKPIRTLIISPSGSFIPEVQPSLDEIMNPLIESLEAIFSFKEANDLIFKLYDKSNKAKLSTLLKRIIEIIPSCLNAASDSGFGIDNAKKTIIQLSRDLVHSEDSMIRHNRTANNLKWVFLSAGKNKIDGDELAQLWIRLLDYRKNKYKHFDIYNSTATLPILFEAGLNCRQIGDILIALDKELGDSQSALEPLSRAVTAYHKQGIDPTTTYQSFMKFVQADYFPINNIDKILNLGMKILGLTTVEIDQFLQDASIDPNKSLASCWLPGKLEKLELFATGLDSVVARRLRDAILNRDFDYIRYGDLVSDAKEIFVNKDGPLTNSNGAYYTKRSRAQGLADLKNLVTTSDAEGLWLYSPSGNTWYCLGGKTSLYEGAVGHQIYEDFDFTQLPQDLELFHTHPLNLSYKPGVNLNARVIKDPDVLDKITALSCAMPSRTDLCKFRYILEATNPNNLAFKIVHDNGVTNVGFKPCSPEEFQPLINKENWANIKHNFFTRMLRHTDLDRDNFIKLGIRSFNEDLGGLVTVAI